MEALNRSSPSWPTSHGPSPRVYAPDRLIIEGDRGRSSRSMSSQNAASYWTSAPQSPLAHDDGDNAVIAVTDQGTVFLLRPSTRSVGGRVPPSCPETGGRISLGWPTRRVIEAHGGRMEIESVGEAAPSEQSFQDSSPQ